MNQSQIIPFNYRDFLIRVVTLGNGEPGFVASDVAKVLEHSNIVKTGNGEPEEVATAIYARVSSSDRKSSLDGQAARLLMFANANGLPVSRTVTKIGSGLNGHRTKLVKLLADSTVKTIIVEHRDRLMRFGCEYVEASLLAQGRKIIVADPSELRDDLVRDMVEVLTSFCARLYDRRAAKNKAEKALKAMETDAVHSTDEN